MNFNRLATVVLVAGYTLAASSAATQADPIVGVKGYSFEAPAGWVVQQNVGGADVLAVDPTPANLPTTITLSLDLLSPKDSSPGALQRIVDKSVETLRGGLKSFKLIGETPETLAGEKAISCEATYDAKGTGDTAKLHQIFAIRGSLEYTLTLITDAAKQDAGEASLAYTIGHFGYGSLNGAAFTSPDGYSVTPPASWTVFPQLSKHTVYFVEQGAREFGANISISIKQTIPTEYTAQRMYEERDSFNGLRYPTAEGFTVISQTVSNVGGLKALDTVLLSKAPDGSQKPLRMRHLMIPHNGLLYEVMAMCLESTHTKYDAVFQDVVRSFRWTPGDSNSVSN